nr:Flagellar regulator flk [Candidatus Pantoea persica]
MRQTLSQHSATTLLVLEASLKQPIDHGRLHPAAPANAASHPRRGMLLIVVFLLLLWLVL